MTPPPHTPPPPPPPPGAEDGMALSIHLSPPRPPSLSLALSPDREASGPPVRGGVGDHPPPPPQITLPLSLPPSHLLPPSFSLSLPRSDHSLSLSLTHTCGPQVRGGVGRPPQAAAVGTQGSYPVYNTYIYIYTILYNNIYMIGRPPQAAALGTQGSSPVYNAYIYIYTHVYITHSALCVE